MSEFKKKVVKYVYSDSLLYFIDKNPAITGRSKLVHELIKSYGLLGKLPVIPPRICSSAELAQFHSSDYLSALKSGHELEEFGLGYDCPIWDGIFDYCKIVGGSTLAASFDLCRKQSDIVINWFGGWHHSQKDKAGGYCYVNDIVLGIMLMLKVFKRVLYIDIDVHHGDGVEGAFETSNRVFTLSFHQHEPGFFPGSGNSTSTGFASGKESHLEY
uniref:histone deacetylase n=1 Tax=Megaselia scalaris TaxID=36166 RepID=T1GBQ7_MEGSC